MIDNVAEASATAPPVNSESDELAKELTKDNIYTRMMDIAHQALLSRGLDLLILVS